MKVAVTGGRNYILSVEDRRWFVATLVENDVRTLVHGAARGVDTECAEIARSLGIEVVAFPAEWKVYGRKSAGRIRNRTMLVSGVEALIAFPGWRGTPHAIETARKLGIPVWSRE